MCGHLKIDNLIGTKTERCIVWRTFNFASAPRWTLVWRSRISGGVGALVPWLPIKAYRPCPSFTEAKYKYTRQGQSLNEVRTQRRVCHSEALWYMCFVDNGHCALRSHPTSSRHHDAMVSSPVAHNATEAPSSGDTIPLETDPDRKELSPLLSGREEKTQCRTVTQWLRCMIHLQRCRCKGLDISRDGEPKRNNCRRANVANCSGMQVVFARRQGTMDDITMDDSFGAMKEDADVPAPGGTKEADEDKN